MKYIIKRILLMLMTLFIIMTISFVLIKMLQPEVPATGAAVETDGAAPRAGYDKPILVQYGIYLRNILTKWDWGTS